MAKTNKKAKWYQKGEEEFPDQRLRMKPQSRGGTDPVFSVSGWSKIPRQKSRLVYNGRE